MQIEDGKIIGWLWWIVTSVIGGIVFLVGFIYNRDRTQINADRARITALEKSMNNVVTMPQVKQIVDDVKTDVKQDHHDIVEAINHSHEAMRSYIRDMFEAREGKWNGRNRRKH